MKSKIISPMIKGLDNFMLAGQWLFSNYWMIRKVWSDVMYLLVQSFPSFFRDIPFTYFNDFVNDLLL